MLDLCDAPTIESVRITIFTQADGVPKTERRLHAELALEGPQGRARVGGPVAPGAASEAILEEHADDGHHREPAVGYFCAELRLPRCRIVGCEQRRPPPHVSWLTYLALALAVPGQLSKRAIGDDLAPPRRRDLRDCRQTVRDVSERKTG